MKPEWKAFLIDAGAEFDDEGVVSFGNPEREKRLTNNGESLCDLSHFGIISVTGDDATTFLQGQFSNDINLISEEKAQFSSYCTAKGRMLANFIIFKRKAHFYIVLPQELLESILKRLRMYVLMSKVVIEDASQQFVQFGYSDPKQAGTLQQFINDIPKAPYAVSHSADYAILAVAGVSTRYRIFAELDTGKQLWDKLNAHAAPVGRAQWGLLNIEAGIPTVTTATSEAFVPQMANMELIDGVSFKKGCYPGQEIVARMQYLGKNKRRTYRYHILSDSQPKAGDEIIAPDEERAVGKICNTQPHPDGGYDSLIVMQIANHAAENLQLENQPDSRLRLSELPYPVTE